MIVGTLYLFIIETSLQVDVKVQVHNESVESSHISCVNGVRTESGFIM